MADATDLGVATRVEGLLAMLGDVTGKEVVDIGCGDGAIARALAERGAIVVGYDPFIAGTGDIVVASGRYRLGQARAETIPRADASVDIVLFVFSLHHVPATRMGLALAEARRLLRPGGILCVAEPVAEGPAQYVMEPYHDETAVRRQAIDALAAHAAPAFAAEHVALFDELRPFRNFDAFAEQAIAGMRFNSYTEADVLVPEVRRRFDAMAADHGTMFRQPVRINLFQ